jgi:hypothetical protein
MTKIFNGTPHAINVVDNGTFDATLRKTVTTNPNVVVSIPSNGVLSAKIETTDGNPINGIPTFVKRITGFDPIPDGYDVIIVSALYASAAMASGKVDMSKIYTVSDPVYSVDGKTIYGCKGIAPFM